jgi:hypothetical protein
LDSRLQSWSLIVSFYHCIFLDGFLTFLIWFNLHRPKCELLLDPKLRRLQSMCSGACVFVIFKPCPWVQSMVSTYLACHGIFGGITNFCSTNNSGLLDCIKPKPHFVHKEHLK